MCSDSSFHLNKLIRFRMRENWTILKNNESFNGYKSNLIRFVLIFNHIDMNGIMMKSFFEVHFSLLSTLSPLKSK